VKVGQVCTRGVVSITRSASLIDVARLMCDRHVGAVVIVGSTSDQCIPVGIITDRDVVRAQLPRVADLSRVQAGEGMTRDPLVLTEDESVENAIRHMRARGVRRAPVVSATGALVGIVSTDDLLGQLAEMVTSLAQLVGQQPKQECAAAYAS
jgi:CBS domain-containing protein